MTLTSNWYADHRAIALRNSDIDIRRKVTAMGLWHKVQIHVEGN